MQIYYTDPDPYRCAANLPDQLTYSTLKEIAQLMSKFLWENGVEAPYENIAQGVKFCAWIKSNYANWCWLYLYAGALNCVYMEAYGKEESCKSLEIVKQCSKAHLDHTLPCPSRLFYSNRRNHSRPPFVGVKNFDPSIIPEWDKKQIKTKYRYYLNWKVNNWKRESKCFRLYSWTNRETPGFIKFD